MTHFKKHFDGENAGESVVELTQELVPVPVHIHRILCTMGELTLKRPGCFQRHYMLLSAVPLTPNI